MVYSLLPHLPAFLQAPDYIPAQTVTNRGNGVLANDSQYHVHMALFLRLKDWFLFLKEQGVYDNTRIIIAADHGSVMPDNPQNITLPNGHSLSTYNPLLMVKDFYSKGNLTIDNSFMTNADAPLLALENIINKPVNPFTQKPLQSDKAQGIDIATFGAVGSREHTKYQYKASKNQWLFVKDNIFIPENWKAP